MIESDGIKDNNHCKDKNSFFAIAIVVAIGVYVTWVHFAKKISFVRVLFNGVSRRWQWQGQR